MKFAAIGFADGECAIWKVGGVERGTKFCMDARHCLIGMREYAIGCGGFLMQKCNGVWERW